MRTKELGWPCARASRARLLIIALSVASLAIVASTGTSLAADQKKARDKMVELNKQALLSYEAKDYQAARDLLSKALKEAKQAGLDDDKMTARTYLHLGAVQWVGFQDQSAAIQNFTQAKKIRPDIQLTPSIETPDLKSVFDLAVVEPEPSPTPEPTRSGRGSSMPTPEPTPELASSNEPDLPSTMPSPLMCSTPEESPPGKELSIRCALKPGIKAESVQLHYRASGAEGYQTVPMHRTAKGWYLATIPGHAMKSGSVQVYYDARDASDNQLASNGQEDSPSLIDIRKKSGGGGSRAAAGPREGDPLAGIKRQQELERYEAGLHRRRAGAFWLLAGGGMGWGYAPKGNVEWAKDNGKPLEVGAVTTTTGLFHIIPEVGYMWTDNFSLSLQLRMEFIRQDQARKPDKDLVRTGRPGSPATMAPAFFLRGLWFFDLTSGGNFQASAGAAVGGGYVRFPIKPQYAEKTVYNPTTGENEKQIDLRNTIEKTDTRPMGIVLLGPSAGLMYHMSRHFALSLEARVLLGFPDFGFAVEGDVGLVIAVGGKAGPTAESEEEEGGEGEGETGAIRESAPEHEEPPPSSSSDEQEE